MTNRWTRRQYPRSTRDSKPSSTDRRVRRGPFNSLKARKMRKNGWPARSMTLIKDLMRSSTSQSRLVSASSVSELPSKTSVQAKKRRKTSKPRLAKRSQWACFHQAGAMIKSTCRCKSNATISLRQLRRGRQLLPRSFRIVQNRHLYWTRICSIATSSLTLFQD